MISAAGVGDAPVATRADSVAKHLERIGDDATNLAEMVVHMAHASAPDPSLASNEQR